MMTTDFFGALKGDKIPAKRDATDQHSAHNLMPRCQCKCRPS